MIFVFNVRKDKIEISTNLPKNVNVKMDIKKIEKEIVLNVTLLREVVCLLAHKI